MALAAQVLLGIKSLRVWGICLLQTAVVVQENLGTARLLGMARQSTTLVTELSLSQQHAMPLATAINYLLKRGRTKAPFPIKSDT